jgi:hypothetical protein
MLEVGAVQRGLVFSVLVAQVVVARVQRTAQSHKPYLAQRIQAVAVAVRHMQAQLYPVLVDQVSSSFGTQSNERNRNTRTSGGAIVATLLGGLIWIVNKQITSLTAVKKSGYFKKWLQEFSVSVPVPTQANPLVF